MFVFNNAIVKANKNFILNVKKKVNVITSADLINWLFKQITIVIIVFF